MMLFHSPWLTRFHLGQSRHDLLHPLCGGISPLHLDCVWSFTLSAVSPWIWLWVRPYLDPDHGVTFQPAPDYGMINFLVLVITVWGLTLLMVTIWKSDVSPWSLLWHAVPPWPRYNNVALLYCTGIHCDLNYFTAVSRWPWLELADSPWCTWRMTCWLWPAGELQW